MKMLKWIQVYQLQEEVTITRIIEMFSGSEKIGLVPIGSDRTQKSDGSY